ncbi:MAG: phosphotransferase [Phocaeicola sp.]|uniref:phosphotransferase enzyme family protein n=1 Tax=Phocaeicola sp. TaxID=2773926 RepID=UPI0023C03881|nr:phosphotransferase [Phocaeicola sp.]MDE5678749.1 phosphotransferase [Phocaeicola sp.]MDE6180649.1 phosphotransferase [Phocaeicola sp.]
MENLIQIIKQFPEVGEIKEIKALTSGLINQTYLVKSAQPEEPDYVLQRINHLIFTDIEMLQHNIETVTSHIRQKLEARHEEDIERKVLRFLPAADGKTYFYDGEGYWRISIFIPRSQTLEAVTPESSYLAGLKFGEFQAMLADVPEQLGEIIPDFHNMEFRMKQLREAVAANASGRLSEVQDIVDAIEADANDMCCAEQLYREGKLPKRICHCDTKVSNMLFDENGEVLCVIDLDTVMPSFIFSDFGDFLRSAANTGKEDEQDLNNVRFNMEIFKAFAKGYVQSARAFLTPVEIEHLPYAATLFPYMQAVRFLADYINGDTYYRTTYDGQNLVRTKAQYKLYQEAKAAVPEMKAYIDSLL